MAEIELPNPEEIEEKRSKQFTRRVALTTAVFAVILAITSLGGNHATKHMLLAQQQASDQWAFYQSKVIREHLYRLQQRQIEAALAAKEGKGSAEDRKRIEPLIKELAAEEGRYRSEKKEIEEEAKRLEGERDEHRAKDPYFDYAEVLLQISIVMASISILSLSRTVFYFALGAAAIGSALCVNGFLMLFRLPFFQ